MPRRPIVKREPARATLEDLDRLEARGWRLDLANSGTTHHPRLAHPWPIQDALRLEGECDAGNRAAVRLLGRPPAP